MAKQVEIFTRKDFEDALPADNKTGLPLCDPLGLQNGEYVYRLGVNPHVEIIIRSSVKADGKSAPSGEDSIRLWLSDRKTGKPLFKKLTRWVTRVPGWQKRLVDQARTLYKIGRKIEPCKCGTVVLVRAVKKEGPNQGKLFAACGVCNYFEWVGE